MVIHLIFRLLRIRLLLVGMICGWSATVMAQMSLAERYQAVEKLWQAGDLAAIGANWEADSSLFLAPAAPRPKNEKEQLQLAKLLRRIADTQQLLSRPDREAFVWRTLLLAHTANNPRPDSLELEIRGQLLKFSTLDERAYNLPDTAARYFGANSYHHRKAVYLAAMKAYNNGENEGADSVLTSVPVKAPLATFTDSVEQAFLLRMYGVQAMAATDYAAARGWYARALTISPPPVGAYVPHTLIRIDLADAYRASGAYDSAHWQLDTALLEANRLTPELLQLKGLVHLRRAMTYRSANRLRLAARALERADEHLAAYPTSLSYQADLMLTRSTLASVRRQRQDWPGAAEAYLRCIELAQARREPNSLQLLGLNLNYAGVLGLCGNFTEGYARAKKALELSRKRFGDTHLYVAVALNTMAENLIGLGQFDEAETLAKRSLAIRQELYPPGHERLMYPNNVLARLLEEGGRPAAAVAYRQQVIEICTGKYGPAAANCREQRIDWIRGLILAGKDAPAVVALRELNTDFPPDLPLPEADNPAFDIAQLYLQGLLREEVPKGGPFAKAIARFDEVQFGFDAEEAAILLAGAYGDVFRQQALYDYQKVGPPEHRLRAWASVARLKYNALWRFRHERSVRNRLLPEAVQHRLATQEQALAEAQSLRRASRRTSVPVSADSLARLVEVETAREQAFMQLKDSIRNHFPAYSASRFEVPQVDWAALQAQLAPSERVVEFFWADSLVIVFSLATTGLMVKEFVLSADDAATIDQYYTAISNAGSEVVPPTSLAELVAYLQRFPEPELTIISDGPLNRISWAGMPLPGGRFLAEEKTIRYAWSVHDLQEPPVVAPTGYPVYGVFPEQEAGLPSRQEERTRLQNIVTLQLDSGRYWTEERQLPPGVWHFATHAFADFNQPANTYLILPGAQERLFVPDLRVPDASLPLVVLSACETGTGRWQAGEGANSIARAFARAGARTTLTTLWKVPDAAAATITTAFYRELVAGETQERALQLAQQKYLAGVDDPRQRAPLYWAGFVLTGEGGELELAMPGFGFGWWLGGGALAGLIFVGGSIIRRRGGK